MVITTCAWKRDIGIRRDPLRQEASLQPRNRILTAFPTLGNNWQQEGAINCREAGWDR